MKIFTDQTGRFPITSSTRKKYIMILYDYDINSILTETMTSRDERELIRATEELHGQLTARGLKPQLQILDNECPRGLKQWLKQQEVGYQLVPPHIHRRNAAERAIATFKDHFITTLCGADPNFPMHLWCRTVTQATRTLNMLRRSRICLLYTSPSPRD